MSFISKEDKDAQIFSKNCVLVWFGIYDVRCPQELREFGSYFITDDVLMFILCYFITDYMFSCLYYVCFSEMITFFSPLSYNGIIFLNVKVKMVPTAEIEAKYRLH